jgi:alcohol dehydrogenase
MSSTMHGLVLDGIRALRVADDLPWPVVKHPTDAVVRVHVAGLCGSDLHPWSGREPFLPGVVAGHEVVGEVTAIGEQVATICVGDRVIVPFSSSCGVCPPCRRGLSARCLHGELFGWGAPDGSQLLHGGQAEALRVPHADGTLVVLPDALDELLGVLLADNLPTGWFAAQRVGARAGEAAVVLGCGTVGLSTIVALHAHGVGLVIAVDPVAGRRARAADLGARACLPDEIAAITAELTGGEGVAGVVDAAGSSGSFVTAVALTRPGGTVQVIAVPTHPTLELAPSAAYDRNLTVRFGRAPVRSLLPEVIDAVLDGRLRPPTDHVITEAPLALDAGPAAYIRAADPTDGVGKLVFRP